MTFVVLGLGSNRSWNGLSPLQLLGEACKSLKKLFCHGFQVSSVYISEPMYYEKQEKFHNMAVCGWTELSPYQLLNEIHSVEAELGRNRSFEIENGPRSIDVDIEIFGNQEIDYTDPSDAMKNLRVPHERLSERAFVLIPMLEILIESADALKADLYSDYLSKLDVSQVVKFLDRSDFEKSVMNQE